MEKVKTTKLQLLRRDFENLCMKKSDNIDSFFTYVIDLVTHIRSHGEVLEERRIVEKLLRVLPSKFDVIVTTIEETKDLTNFSVDELHASLITHEQRLSRNENSYLEHALRPSCPSEEKEVRARETREEEAEAKTEVEETIQQILKEEATIQIRINAKGAVNEVDNIMLMDKGMKNPMLNVTIVKNMAIMQMNRVQKGYNVFFENDVCTIMDRRPNKLCVAEVKMTRNRMFSLRIKVDLKDRVELAIVTQEAFQSEPNDENWLWHLRFGHLNFGGLNLLNRKGMNKSEVFEKFLNFKALVENQSGLHIKVLRTDRGGEYISKEFLSFCRENGIHKQFTTRYTPQQNCVAERKNMTIMDMAKSMLKEKHLPNDYWAEAVHYAA
eukprot:PITA_19893